jgi:hypothetical protein
MNKHYRAGLKTYKSIQNLCIEIRRKLVGRGSRHALEDNIKTDFKEMGCDGVRSILLRIEINADPLLTVTNVGNL